MENAEKWTDPAPRTWLDASELGALALELERYRANTVFSDEEYAAVSHLLRRVRYTGPYQSAGCSVGLMGEPGAPGNCCYKPLRPGEHCYLADGHEGECLPYLAKRAMVGVSGHCPKCGGKLRADAGPGCGCAGAGSGPACGCGWRATQSAAPASPP